MMIGTKTCSNILVTVTEGSCKPLTWDLSGIVHDKKAWVKEEEQLLKFKGGLVAHESPVKVSRQHSSVF